MNSVKRLAYIDALKGVLIFYVLLHHFIFISVNFADSVVTEVLFRLAAMPAFFIISGYLYKDRQMDKMKELGSRLAKMAQHLLLPTFCCLILFIIVQNGMPGRAHLTLVFCLQDQKWYGYWFTSTLFVIYSVIHILRFITPKSIFFSLNMLFLVSSPIIMHFVWRCLDPSTNMFCIRQSLEYLPFYSLGILISNYRDVVNRYLQKEAVRFCILFVCGICLVAISVYDIDSYVLFSYARLFFSLLLFVLFQKSAEYWERDTRFTNFCRVVGQSSFGIYLLHYFFLPRNMQFLWPYLEHNIPMQIAMGGGNILSHNFYSISRC